MYRRRQRGNSFSTLILLGVLAGVAFLLYDTVFNTDQGTVPVITQEQITPQTTTENTDVVAVAPTPQSVGYTYESITNASLFIPSAGINAPIISAYLNGRSWDIENLGMNIGHLQGTNWVTDGTGNIVLSGHVEMRDGRKGVFEPIKGLVAGDIILLRYEDEERRYSVTEIYNVQPDDLTPLYPTEEDRLTLLTCDSYNFLSNTYQERTVVIAERIL